jgi:uncharacterized protein (DUF1800 family)
MNYADDPKQAWEPFTPSPAEPWDIARVAHLHRRAGFGATWTQIQRDRTEGFEASLGRILHGDNNGPDGKPAKEFEETLQVMEDSARRSPSLQRVVLLWLYRLMYTPFPLAEKMTLFWHNHFATSAEKVRDAIMMLEQNRTQRSLWRESFSKLLLAMLRDQAMLKWLDALENHRGDPNENLAREFLELFALGEGHYSEDDIRQVARALTGWREVSGATGPVIRYVPAYHDDGPKTILGARGPWGDKDVVRLVCQQPAAAMHIARRLYLHFISDTEPPPTSKLLEPLAEVMRVDGDVDLSRGLERLLRSRLFYGPECRGQRIKNPVEYAVGAFRSSEAFLPDLDLAELEGHVAKMGQRLFYPPNVGGWPGGLSWLRGSTLLARANFAALFADPKCCHGPRHLLGLSKRHGWKAPEERMNGFASLFLGAPLKPAKKKELTNLDCGRMAQQLLSLPEAQVC